MPYPAFERMEAVVAMRPMEVGTEEVVMGTWERLTLLATVAAAAAAAVGVGLQHSAGIHVLGLSGTPWYCLL